MNLVAVLVGPLNMLFEPQSKDFQIWTPNLKSQCFVLSIAKNKYISPYIYFGTLEGNFQTRYLWTLKNIYDLQRRIREQWNLFPKKGLFVMFLRFAQD